MKWTAPKIKALKGEKKIAMLTAYDALTASLVDGADIPAVLVGDSLANTVLGYETTLPVSMTEMLHHTAAAARGVSHALLLHAHQLFEPRLHAQAIQAPDSNGRILQFQAVHMLSEPNPASWAL